MSSTLPSWKREMLAMFRQSTALTTLLSFVIPMLVPRLALAEREGDAPVEEHAPSPQTAAGSEVSSSAGTHALPLDPRVVEGTSEELAPPSEGGDSPKIDPSKLNPALLQDALAPSHTLNLPTGADKSGVSSQAISMPQGAGKIQGMGESFSAQLSTGIGTFSVPFSLPPARGGVSPSLGLSYSSSGGHGLAGVGWDVGVPSISRQTDRGLPKYMDPGVGGPWHAQQDTFVYNGGQELVPLGVVHGQSLTGATLPAGETMPDWADGWQYFRPRVEGSFLRFFWSPDHKTWRVQDKSGTTMELGVPLGANASLPPSGEIETDPSHPDHVFRWNLSRQYDAQPNAVNHVVYRYLVDSGMSYLSDIFYTSPVANPSTPGLEAYAHHVKLNYDARPDDTFSFRRGWRVGSTLRLSGIDITSKTFSGQGSRRQVRRYHLGYDPSLHASLLTSVQMEGRCHPTGPNGIGEDQEAEESGESSGFALPGGTACPTLPSLTLGYEHVEPYKTDGSVGVADLPGYEGFDERIASMHASPDHSADEAQTDLFDINHDGLPDILVTAPGLYPSAQLGGQHGVYLNSIPDPNHLTGAAKDTFFPTTAVTAGVNGVDTNILKLSNDNVVALDLDGDAISNLLHMPLVKKYQVFTPVWGADALCTNGGLSATGKPCNPAVTSAMGSAYVWLGHDVTTSDQLDVKIDFTHDAKNTRVMDVNGDGLVDVVKITGTEVETFLSLGNQPGGEGRFGTATRTSSTTADLSTSPITTCIPWSATPVRFDDKDIHLADMNGDGLTDIVRLRNGDIRYWPGRGNGVWGTGESSTCTAGTFGQERHIAMTSSPTFANIDGQGLRVDDVNGDGLDDIVQVRFDGVDIWLNVDGQSWTPRHVIANPPASPAYANRLRLVDMNGSGTRDLLWGDGASDGNAPGYRYIDLAGGKRPWVLTHVENGLGKTTDIEYSTSATQMIAAAQAGKPWASYAPSPLHIVSRVTEHDNLSVVGRPAGEYTTEYTYRDPVYDGLQHEFRGFRDAQARRIGDDNSPDAVSTSHFLLGECAGEGKGACAFEDRWKDNANEALKGLPTTGESFDDQGVYPSTTHHTYGLRRLYAGLDGRGVWYAYERSSDAWAYDTAPFTPADSTTTVNVVVREYDGQDNQPDTEVVHLRASAGRVRTSGSVSVDGFGNRSRSISQGCVEGCTTSDETIVSFTVAQKLDHPSGWMWRTSDSFVTNNATAITADGVPETQRRHHGRTTYDANGNPTDTFATLRDTLDVERFHEDVGAEVAPLPPHRSQAGTLTLSHTKYNAFGQPTATWGAGGRCRTSTIDPTFSQLPMNETVYVGALSETYVVDGHMCGSLPLTSEASYDRGLSAPVEAKGLHNERSAVEYDGLGRVTQMWAPRPDDPTQLSPHPSMKAEYQLTSDPVGRPYSILHSSSFDGASLEDEQYMDAWAYVDGMGRTLVTLGEADPEVDGHSWVVNGLTEYDKKGAARRAYLAWYWDGDPTQFPLSEAPTTPYGRQRYDAFGRKIQTFGLDGSVTLATRYHALSTDAYDASDLEPGPHQGTFVTAKKDGHGRATTTVERVHEGSAIALREIRTSYLYSGEVSSISRVRVGKPDAPVIRWMRYDSLGRMVLNAEPHTTGNFTSTVPDPYAPFPATDLKAWRYSYDDAGELVGTSDSRGCGVNYYYDTAGRLIVEDYSPCLSTHVPYSAPWLGASGTMVMDEAGAEVLYHFDTPDPETQDISTWDPSTNSQKAFVSPGAEMSTYTTLSPGRLISVTDRGSKVVTRFDGRGRSTGIAKKIATPAVEGDSTVHYAPRWYVQEAQYDGADRPVLQTTGATVNELMGAGQKSHVTSSYTARGTVKAVGGAYGTLVQGVTRDADGLVGKIVYGDLASTTTAFTYDNRRRVRTVQTYRGPPASWTSPPANYLPAPAPSGDPTTFQLVLQDDELSYDSVDNPVEVHDWRNPAEWPASAKPVSRRMQYDDLNRVTKIDYQYQGGPDAWTSPFDEENSGDNLDPRRAAPSPHVVFDNRVLSQSFAFDWLGNTTSTDDDAHGFYDRSLGGITNTSAATQQGKAYQLTAATQTGPRGGSLAAKYDVTGNLVDLSVQRSGSCLPLGAVCSQRFVYDWDEVGRLVRARRWDTPNPQLLDPASAGAPAADLRHVYDHGDNRVVKTAVDGAGESSHTAYVFGSLELRRAPFDDESAPGDYEDSTETEVAYLFDHGVRLARLHYDDAGAPEVGGAKLHVLFELGDHLGSSSKVLDKATSELVEASSYLGYGQADSDYRPARWKGFREDYRFTGKEEDSEVGLTYFGKRFLSSALGRWASADPLAVHGLGADLNLYAYVHGSVLRSVDPVGLSPVGDGAEGTDSGTSLPKAEPAPVPSESPIASGAQGSSGGEGGGISEPSWMDEVPSGIAAGAQGTGSGTTSDRAAAMRKPATVSSPAPTGDFDGAQGRPSGYEKPRPAAPPTPEAWLNSGNGHHGGYHSTPEEMATTQLGDPWFVPKFLGYHATVTAPLVLSLGELGGAAAALGRAGSAGERALVAESGAATAEDASVSVGTELSQTPGGSIRNVNPTRGTHNCANCAVATDATLSGHPASALPGGPTQASELATLYKRNWIPTTGERGINIIMTEWGPGSRGIVWGTRGSEVGHYFNVVNQEGAIRFLDGQTGRPATFTGYDGIYLLRTH